VPCDTLEKRLQYVNDLEGHSRSSEFAVIRLVIHHFLLAACCNNDFILHRCIVFVILFLVILTEHRLVTDGRTDRYMSAAYAALA